MSIDEILKQYDQEWLLIEVEKFDENWEPLEGRVIFHSPNDNDISREMLKLRGRKIDLAVRFAGEFPRDLAVML